MGCGEGGADQLLIVQGHVEDCAAAGGEEPSVVQERRISKR